MSGISNELFLIVGLLLWLVIGYACVKKKAVWAVLFSFLSATFLFLSLTINGSWLYLAAIIMICLGLYTRQNIFYMVSAALMFPLTLYFLLGAEGIARLYALINILPIFFLFLNQRKLRLIEK